MDPGHIYYPKLKLQQDRPESVCRVVMARTQNHKLVHRPGGVSELYDLVTDPRELHNVYGRATHATAQSTLERLLLDWYTRTSDVTPYHEDPRGFTDPN